MKFFILVLMICLSINHCKTDFNIELEQIIVNPQGLPGTKFGQKVTVNNDKLYIPAADLEYRYDDFTADRRVGRIYIYERTINDNNWALSDSILPDTIVKDFFFGNNISVHGDWMIVSAEGMDSLDISGNLHQDIGAVYIYKYNIEEKKWNYYQKITGTIDNSPLRVQLFLHIEGNNMFLAHTDKTTFGKSGGLFHYKLNESTGMWQKVDRIKLSGNERSAEITLYMDVGGEIIVLTDLWRDKDFEGDIGIIEGTGAAEIFKYDKVNELYKLVDIITPEVERLDQYFGDKPYVHEDEVYIYQYRGIDPNFPTSQLRYMPLLKRYRIDDDGKAELKQIISPSTKSPMTSWTRLMSVEGNIMAIAARNDNWDENGENPNESFGAVHIYTRESKDDNWTYRQKIVPENRELIPTFGQYVEIIGDKLYIDCYHIVVDENGWPKGHGKDAVYVYKIDTTTTSVPIHENKPPTPQITISPNPISDVTTIGIPAVGDVRVYLTDITGAAIREIWSGTAEVPTSVMMDAASLSQGEYYVVAESAKGVMSEKIVVER